MKVTIKKASLESALYAAFRAVNLKCPSDVLTGIHIECKDGNLTATGSNIETTISRTVTAEPGSENVSVVIPGRKFYDLVRKIDRETVQLETTPDAVTIKYGTSKTTLKTFREEEFPYTPTVDRVDYQLSAEEFASALKIYPLCYAGTEKPIYTGVNFNITPFGAEFTATDTHRIAVSRMALEGNDVKAVIPQGAIKESINLLSGTLRITIEEKMIVIQDSNTRILSMVIAGVFSDAFAGLFTGEFTSKVELNPKSIIPTLDRVVSIQEKKNVVKVSLNGALELSFDGESSEIQEKVEVLSQEGEFASWFNTKYLLEAIQICSDSDKIVMYFGKDQKPCKIETEKTSILLFPLRAME